MPIVPTNISDVPVAAVTAAYAQQMQYMQETNPGLDTARGAFSDIVLLTNSQLNAVMTTTVSNLQQSGSLLQIQANPTLADTTIVDALLSNYNTTRLQGTTSTGNITMVVSQSTPVVIPAGSVFTANGQTYTTTAAFTASLAANPLASPADRLLSPLTGGNYSFTFSVVAAVAGSVGNISQNTSLLPSTPPTYFVSCYAASDFSGGYDTETNADLLARLQTGPAAKSIGGAVNYLAFIQSQAEFARTLAYSFVGIGDPEMKRDRYGLLPISRGGCIDVYARPAELPLTLPIQLTAVYVGSGTWQVAVANNVFPGFYSATKITNTTDAPTVTGFEITSDIRGNSFTGTLFPPIVPSLTDTKYTAFQTAVLQYFDPTTTTATAIGCKKNVVVFLTGMPMIGDLQALFSNSVTSSLSASVLVKATVPCNVSVGVSLVVKSTAAQPNTAGIAAAIASTVNNLPFGDTLYTSLIDGAILPLLTAGQVVGRIDLTAQLTDNLGNLQTIIGERALRIPYMPEVGVSTKTTAFMLDPSNISITVTQVA